MKILSIALTCFIIAADAVLADPFGPSLLGENLTYLGRYSYYPNYTHVVPAGDTLYYIDNTMLGALDISDPERPELIWEVLKPGEIKFMGRSNDLMYLFSERTGYFIFDLSEPRREGFTGFVPQPNYFPNPKFLINDSYLVSTSSQGVFRSRQTGFPDRMPEIFIDTLGSYRRLNAIYRNACYSVRGISGIDIIDCSGRREEPVMRFVPDTGVNSIVISDGVMYMIDDRSRFYQYDLDDPFEPELIDDGRNVDLGQIRNFKFLTEPHEGILLVRSSFRNCVYAVDISDPARPEIAADLSEVYQTLTFGPYDAANQRLYSLKRDVIRVWDLFDPTDPQVIAEYGDADLDAGSTSLLMFRDYALCGRNDSLMVFDLSDPVLPELVAQISMGEEGGDRLLGITSGEVLYTHSRTPYAWDISDPTDPEPLGAVDVRGRTAYKIWVDDLLYAEMEGERIDVYDFSESWQGTFLGEMNLNSNLEIEEFIVHENILYARNSSNMYSFNEIVSIDVSDPTEARALDSLEFGWTPETDLMAVGGWLLTRNRIIDIDDPSRMRIVGRFHLDTGRNTNSRFSRGNLLFATGDYYTEIFDYSDPFSPQCIAFMVNPHGDVSTRLAVRDNLLAIATSNALTTFEMPAGIEIEPTISPRTVDFGEVTVGDSAEVTLQITNHDDNPLELFFLRSPYPSISSPEGLREIAPDRTREYRLKFRPEEEGEVNGFVLIRYAWNWLPVEVRAAGVTLGARIEDSVLPTEFAIDGFYPNPFNSTTTLRFRLPAISQVRLNIYASDGRRMEQRELGVLPAGQNNVQLDAVSLPSGVYIAELWRDTESLRTKMVVIK